MMAPGASAEKTSKQAGPPAPHTHIAHAEGEAHPDDGDGEDGYIPQGGAPAAHALAHSDDLCEVWGVLNVWVSV